MGVFLHHHCHTAARYQIPEKYIYIYTEPQITMADTEVQVEQTLDNGKEEPSDVTKDAATNGAVENGEKQSEKEIDGDEAHTEVNGDKGQEVAPEQNGDSNEEVNGKEEAVKENKSEPNAQNKAAKTVASILEKVKNDTEMSSDQKINTLSMLLSKFVEENGVLKNEVGIIMDNMKKHVEHKDTLKMMNDALKRQVDLVKEECELRIKEEVSKRQESLSGFSGTMDELSVLLEAQSGNNDKLLSENSELSAHMSKLLEEAQAREKQFTTQQTELTLQLKLVEAQLKKAQLEKAEVKCEMTQERMEITQELNLERDRSINLERTVNLLREQLDVYEKQSLELSNGVGNNAKQFQHFKTQIEKLTTNMTTMEKETSQWREKSELSAKQVQKMNQVTMEKDKELTSLKKKLEGMVKLNQALTTERSELMDKVKNTEAPAPE